MPRRCRGPLPEPMFGGQLPSTSEITFQDWVEDAVSQLEAYADVFERDAARPEQGFSFYEAAQRMGIPEPPDPAHQWGQAGRAVRTRRRLVIVGATRSTRPGTRGSRVATWRGQGAAAIGEGA